MALKKWNNLNFPLWLMVIILCFYQSYCHAQKTDIPYCENPAFNQLVDDYIDYTVPVISVKELYQSRTDYLLLDAREHEEYILSHLPQAILIGYKNPDFSVVKELPKETPIVIYCSIGYRSEKIGSKLSKLGFTQVKNLYGSIFEWVNQGYPVVNDQGIYTEKIHGYNKKWSRWILNKSMIITY